jgi:predicted nucleic acid-binding protein
MEQALENAYTLGVTVYDACYIALAKQLKSSAYTADKRLKDKVEEVSLKRISEFK